MSSPILGRDVGPVIREGAWNPRSLPKSIVTTLPQLEHVKDRIKRQGRFVFDLETRGIIEDHDYLRPRIESDIRRHAAGMKITPTEKTMAGIRDRIETEYRKMLALDPHRNEVFLMGIAVAGESWAIPMGMRYGKVIIPAEIGDGTTAPPEGYRKLLKSGAESTSKRKYFLHPVLTPPPPQLDRVQVFDAMEDIFFDPEIDKINQNIKFDARSIAKYYGGEIPPGPYWDTISEQFAIDEELKSYALNDLIKHNYDGHQAYEKIGKLGALANDVDFFTATAYVQLDVRWVWLLDNFLVRGIRKYESEVWPTVVRDMRTCEVLMHMEHNGVDIDESRLDDLAAVIDEHIAVVSKKVHAYTGKWEEPFNPNSTEHKRRLMFGGKREGGLALKPLKKSKTTGVPSVDKYTLEYYADRDPVVGNVQEWMNLEKIRSAYVDNIRRSLFRGRVHTNFHLARAVTGRLSASDPPLHQIPRVTGDEGDLGSELRQLFIAPPGWELIVFDYGQIEMRVIAMLSQDPDLMRVFLTGGDIHVESAAGMLGKDPADVTKDERQFGKTAGFAIGFGAGDETVAATAVRYGATFVTPEIAGEGISRFYKRFARVKPWKDELLKQARRDGYVMTIGGRKRRLDDLTLFGDDWATQRGPRYRAERQAINAAVQGSAADLIKDSMISLHETISGTPIEMLLQVHDEIMCRAPIDGGWVDQAMRIVPEAMGHGRIVMGVPIEVEGSHASNWAKAK